MIKWLVWATLAAVALGADEDRARLHPQPPQSKDTKTGAAVGSAIPKFELFDQFGKKQTFDSLRGPKGMLPVFTRSADWCPYCKTQMADLNNRVAAFRKQGLSVVTVTYDSVVILKNFGDRQRIGYPMLSDPDSAVIQAFGIFNTNVEKGNRAYGIPYPGSYVVNERGIVTAKYFEDDYTERYSAGSILTREFGADGAEKTVTETPHLKLTSSASDGEFAPGRRITLILDLDLKPKMHVYAPGIKGYIPIDWSMAESKVSATFAAEYPKSRMLHLKPINETVPVYEGRVHLVRDITIGQDREIASALGKDRTLTIAGEFRYQACDDKECFIPKTIPLQWTFKIGQLDTQRVPDELQRR